MKRSHSSSDQSSVTSCSVPISPDPVCRRCSVRRSTMDWQRWRPALESLRPRWATVCRCPPVATIERPAKYFVGRCSRHRPRLDKHWRREELVRRRAEKRSLRVEQRSCIEYLPQENGSVVRTSHFRVSPRVYHGHFLTDWSSFEVLRWAMVSPWPISLVDTADTSSRLIWNHLEFHWRLSEDLDDEFSWAKPQQSNTRRSTFNRNEECFNISFDLLENIRHWRGAVTVGRRFIGIVTIETSTNDL